MRTLSLILIQDPQLLIIIECATHIGKRMQLTGLTLYMSSFLLNATTTEGIKRS